MVMKRSDAKNRALKEIQRGTAVFAAHGVETQ
jgi:hypothetical protein